MAQSTQVTVRINADHLAELERIGQQIEPKPLNRSEMINVAVREYVERHGQKKPKGK